MKRRTDLVCLLGLCALALACSSDGTPPPPSVDTTTVNEPGHVEREDVVRVSAIVEKIDQSTRVVTLRNSEGRKTTFRAGPDVRNLAQVKKGDQVDVALYRSVAMQLRKAGEVEPGVAAAGAAERAEPGEMPSAAGAQSIKMIATIRALDRANQTATLEGPDGEVATIAVRNPAHFDVAEVGDLVEITYTEAMAISVEKK